MTTKENVRAKERDRSQANESDQGQGKEPSKQSTTFIMESAEQCDKFSEESGLKGSHKNSYLQEIHE